MKLTFLQYKAAVEAALGPLGRSLNDFTLTNGYEDYLACLDVLGEAKITAQLTPAGAVRIFLEASKG